MLSTPVARDHLGFDLSAIVLSALCMLHCVAPLAASALPVFGVWSDSEWVHVGFVLLAAPVSLWAIWLHRGRSGARGFAITILVGVGLLAAGAFAHDFHAWETALTVLGASVLAAAHGWRALQSRRQHNALLPA